MIAMSVLLLSEALYLWLLAALLAGWMIAQFIREKAELISMRNVFLAGFIIYQLSSPAMSLFSNNTAQFRIASMRNAGLEYCFKTTLFLGLFFFFYHKGWPVKKLATKLPTPQKMLTEQGLIVVSIALAVLAVVIKALYVVPVLAYAALFVSMGCATVSVGVVVWWWSQRQGNIVRLSIALGVIALNLVSVMGGNFGRRPLLAIFGAAIWSFYYARVRYSKNRVRVIVVLVLFAVVPAIAAAMFTSARSQDFKTTGSVEMIQQVFRDANILDGLADLLSGQNVGEASLWCMDVFPEHLQRDHLLSLRYVFVANIPRAWWPDKPYVLSTRIADMADIQGVRQDRAKGGGGVTIPPGIMGYAEAEGGLYAVVVYALWMALMIRFLDELVMTHVRRPTVVIPVAASLGNMLGLARGDLAIFVVAAIWAILASFFTLLLMVQLIGYRVPKVWQTEPTQ